MNLHLYPSPFTNETRILRITQSLSKAGIFNNIMIIAALRIEGLPQYENIDAVRSVVRVPTFIKRGGILAKIFNMLEWNIRVLLMSINKKVVCINPHCLSVLPISVVIKLIKSCRLVYDTHEIETETTETKGIRKYISKAVERLLMPFVDVIAVTSEGHGDWYKREFPRIDVRVIRNFPYLRTKPLPSKSILKEKFRIQAQETLFIYQGAIARPRGTDLLMRTFARLSFDKHIVFMGFGTDVEKVKEYSTTHPNIHYHPAVSPNEVADYTSGADVGIHMMDDSCINHLYALPNKPLEYLNAGIPAVVSNLPEMSKLVQEAGAGWVVPVRDEEYLFQFIQNLTAEDVAEKADRAKGWSETHNWQSEEKVLFQMYKDLGVMG